MKRFAFRLQKVLDAREAVERDAQLRLGEAIQELAAQEAKRRGIREELEIVMNEQRALYSGGMSVGKAMQYHRWHRELQKQLRVQDEKCRDAEKTVIQRRAELLEASRERKVLEKLKEKKRSEYDSEDRREQQAILDDIGGRRNANPGYSDHA